MFRTGDDYSWQLILKNVVKSSKLSPLCVGNDYFLVVIILIDAV